MNNNTVINIKPLGFHWETINPFLFCAHHLDAYPVGNDQMEPQATLEGRELGNDFEIRDGWRMYHGTKVPGFPAHPHRGFETITIVLEGIIDHADSLGGAGRYGKGDVQWMTAGTGLQHSEMFPLINSSKENPLELFQIWLNLPASSKFVTPHYKMLWKEDLPVIAFKDSNGKQTVITIIAGNIGDKKALPPPPHSWAANEENDVSVWLIRMEKGASWEIPAATKNLTRSLYFYKGSHIKIAGQDIPSYQAIILNADNKVVLENGGDEGHLLLLQGRPINEPVSQYGPFVMNTQTEIQQTINDYRKTQFGGWPWPRPDHVHERTSGRFAIFTDGRREDR